MKLLITFFTVLTLMLPAVQGTIDYRPRTQKIEITSENTVITITYSSDSSPMLRVTAKHGDTTYEVPEKEARVLSDRGLLSAEVRILPYEASGDPRKVEGFTISFITLRQKKRQDVEFSFLKNATFHQTVVLDVDETGIRPAK